MKSKDELLGEMLDREAIRELPVRYCDCVWRNDMTGLVGLFAEDGVFIVKGHKRTVTHKGRAELKKMYEGALGNVNPRPYIHNHVVDLTGPNKGVGRCYVELRSFSRNMDWIGSGYYEDEYVKTAEGWKFGSRTFTSVGPGIEGAPGQK
jgi:SnoaL-like domain